MKKIVSVLLALALTLTLVGSAVAEDKVNLTAFQYTLENQSTDFNNLWFFQQLEEKTNTHVDFTMVKDGDFQTQLNLMFISGSIGARTTTRKNSRLPDRPQTYSAIWRGTSTPRPPTQEPLNDFPLLPLFSLPSVALARNGPRPGPPDPGGCLEGNPDSHRRQRSGGL